MENRTQSREERGAAAEPAGEPLFRALSRPRVGGAAKPSVARVGAACSLLLAGAGAPLVLSSGCGSDSPPLAPNPTSDSGGGNDATTTRPDGSSSDAGGGDALVDGSDDSATTDDAGDSGVPLTPTVLPIAPGRLARLYGVAYTSAGIFATGQVASASDPNDLAMLLVKLLPNGSLDTSFGQNGVVVHNAAVGGGSGEIARGVVVQSTGKIVIAGVREAGFTGGGDGGTGNGGQEAGASSPTAREIMIVRFNANGTLDGTIGRLTWADGELIQQWGLAVLDNDDLVVSGARRASTDAGAGADAGSLNELVVARIAANGGLDTTFGPAQDGTFALGLPTNISPRGVLAHQGALNVSGYTNANGIKPIVVKLGNTGQLQTNFGTGGVFFPETGIPGFGTGGFAEVYATAPQGGKIVTAGYGKENNNQPGNGWLSLRLLPDGTLDPNFGTAGHAFFGINDQNANCRSVVVLSDKRIVLVGGGSPPKPAADAGTQSQHAAFVVLTENGTLDLTVNPQGPLLFDLGGPATGRGAHHFWGVANSPDSKRVVMVGIKGGITANADAGVLGTPDEAVSLVWTTGL